MNKKTLTLGLIGKDVSKSTSPQIHTFILGQFGVGCKYEKLSISPLQLDDTMRRLFSEFDAFNITIPYKRDVFGYLNKIVDDALACEAVNTVVCATRMGYNTDGKGFCLMLETSGVPIESKRILVLGAGGSGRSVALALKEAGARVYMHRRNRAQLEKVCTQLGVQAAESVEDGGYDILVNCTGVGMHDTEGISPVTKTAFRGAEWAIDLIYTPEQSEFLRIAKDQGVQTLNGAAMLFYQAYFADCLFLGKTPSVEEAKTFYSHYLQTKEA